MTSASLSKLLVTELEEGESAHVCACTVESFAVHLSPAPDGRIYAKWDGPVCGKDKARARLWLYHTGPPFSINVLASTCRCVTEPHYRKKMYRECPVRMILLSVLMAKGTGKREFVLFGLDLHLTGMLETLLTPNHRCICPSANYTCLVYSATDIAWKTVGVETHTK